MWEFGPLPSQGQTLLTLVAAYFTSVGNPPPTRQIRTMGLAPAFDCDQLTVSFAGLTQGQPGVVISAGQTPAQATQWCSWLVQVVRSVNTFDDYSGEPDDSLIDSDSVTHMTDIETLWDALESVRSGGLLFRPNRGAAIGPLRPVGPGGGLVGIACTIAWPLV